MMQSFFGDRVSISCSLGRNTFSPSKQVKNEGIQFRQGSWKVGSPILVRLYRLSEGRQVAT